MKNPNVKYYQIPSKSQFPNPKEAAKETKYWLRLIAGKYIKTELLEEDVKEAQEIINILSAIINKTKRE